jgi:hypothetical protein
MPSSSQHSLPNIFRKVVGIEKGTDAGTNIAFTTPTQPPGSGSGSFDFNVNQNIHKGGMVRPL